MLTGSWSPSGSGRSPAAKRILMHLGINLRLFDCLMTNNFLCLLFIKRQFPTNSLSRPKKITAHNLAVVWGDCKFLGVGEIPPPLKRCLE